jgi:hypothetical protein
MRAIFRSFTSSVGLAAGLAGAACGATRADTIETSPKVEAGTPPTVDSGARPRPAVDAGAPAVDAGVAEEASAPVKADASEAGKPVDNGAPSTTYPAPHPPLPQLVNLAGGEALAKPKVFLVFFAGYPYEQQLITMAQTLGASAQWGGSTAEYGVGPVEYAGMVELSGAAGVAPDTLTDSDVAAFMSSEIASGAFGPPDTSTIYTIFYPETTTITLSGGGPMGSSVSCQSFGGYHDDMAVTLTLPAPALPDAGADAAGDAAPPAPVEVEKNFAYAVLPTCPSFGSLEGLDAVTGPVSHEWVEAATDPFPSTNNGADSAYSSVDGDHFAWTILGGGGEAGDLCVPEDNAFYIPTGFPFTVQRTWSNALANGGHDPCALNIAGTPYFNSAPVLDTNVNFTSLFLGGAVATKGVVIPVGKSKTIEVDLFSDADTGGPWEVSAFDLLSQFTGGPPTLSFAWDRSQGVNGEKLHMTVTMVTSEMDLGGAHPFVITSTLGNAQNTWAGVVTE